jgi:membrane protease YdiL (CAAX protease family)
MNAETDTPTTTSEMAPVAHEPFDRGLIPYFVLAYGITWLFHIFIGVIGLDFSLEFGAAMWIYLVGLLGPLAAAIIVTAHSGGKSSVRTLLASGLQWRFKGIWYLWALFLIPAIMVMSVIVVNRGIPPTSEWLTIPLLLVVGQVWVVVGEEYGWRGFALPRLQVRFGSLGASLILGVLWASWHLPMFFTPGSPQYAEAFWPSFVQYLGFITFVTIIMTMLYNRTGGSVLVCMLLHASLNAAAFSIKLPEGAASIVLTLQLMAFIAAVILLPKPLFRRP